MYGDYGHEVLTLFTIQFYIETAVIIRHIISTVS